MAFTARCLVAPKVFALMLVVSALFACRGADDEADGADALYVLVNTPGQRSELEVLNADTGEKLSHIRLEQADASALAMDADGRVWVGRKSAFGNPTASINVISADLKSQKRVAIAENPGSGIAFTLGRTFVASSRRGFGGALTLVEGESFAKRTVEIAPPEGGAYILTALAASNEKIVLTGVTKGPDPRKRYAAITVVDPLTLKIIWRSQAIENFDVWQILPYEDKFLLLNVASGDEAKNSRSDLMVLDSDNKLHPYSAVPSPLWGKIHHDVLYLYHNPTWNSLRNVSVRLLSAYNLKTGQVTETRLPDNLDVVDMAISGDRIILSVKSSTEAYPGGVYSIDLNGENLKLVAKKSGVGKIISRSVSQVQTPVDD